MNKKSKLLTMSAIALCAIALCSCGTAPAGNAAVTVTAGTAGAGSRAVSAGDAVTTVSAYRVAFAKIEIGNSEADKYTLWESDGGEQKDIVSTVKFEGVQPVPAGSYKFVRLTVGPELSVDGSIDDSGTVYSGTGGVTLDKTTYLWGSVLDGASALDGDIAIADGCTLGFTFNVAGTVTYGGGPASAATLGVSKPTLSVAVN